MKLRLLNQYVAQLEHTVNIANMYISARQTEDTLCSIVPAVYIVLPRYRALSVHIHMIVAAAKTWLEMVYHNSLHDYLTATHVYRRMLQSSYRDLCAQHAIVADIISTRVDVTSACRTLLAMKHDPTELFI